jgi:selenocysteine lyase/cysteine desulfurase
MWRRPGSSPSVSGPAPLLDVQRIRKHFDYPASGRVVTNNAASTQPPRELPELYRSLTPWYENVHRGQSTAADEHRHLPQHHRGDQRGDVLAAHGVPGGDMIAEGQVAPDRVEYNVLSWKYAAGTPNILGVIVSAQALRLLLDLVAGGRNRWFGTSQPVPREAVVSAMHAVAQHTATITEQALRAIRDIPGLTVYGPAPGDPMRLADGLNALGVESRAGCHCATLAHHDLGLTPPASCRLSFGLYTSPDDVERAVDALRCVTEHSPAQVPRPGRATSR